MSNGRVLFGASPGNTVNSPAYVKMTVSGGAVVATNISNTGDEGRGTLQFNAGDITLTGGMLRGTDLSSRDGFNIGGKVPNAGIKMNGGVIQINANRNEGTVYAVPAGVDPVTVTGQPLNRGQWRLLDGSLNLNGGDPNIAGSGRGYSELFATGTSGSSYRYAVRVWMTSGTSDAGQAKTQANAFANSPADVNLDGIVDQSDRNYMESQNGYTYTADPLDVAGGIISFFRADATGDGVVNAADFAVLNDLYGQRTSGGVYAWASDQTVNVASGSQNQSGDYTFANTKALTKTGAGELVLNGSNSFTYPTTVSAGQLTVASSSAFTLASSTVTVQAGATLKVNSGVTMMSPKVAVAGTLDGTGATLSVNAKTGIKSLEIVNNGSVTGSPTVVVSNTGSVTLSNSTPQTVNVQSLTVDTATGGKVDLGRGTVNIASGSAAAIVAAIVQGRNDGAWNGASGISSTAAAAGGGYRAVGWVDNGGGSFTVAFGGAGDVNLNGVVDFDDVVQVLSANLYDSGLPANWADGDYDYNGVYDFDDVVAAVGANLYDTGPYNTAPGLLGGASLVGGSIAAVPEPATWVLVAMGAACAAGRSLRRRSMLRA